MTTATAERRLTELVFLHRGPLAVRGLIVVLAAACCSGCGVALFRLHQTLAPRLSAKEALNALQAFIAGGSSLATLWPGWLAAACFAVALWRLRREPLEPSPGLHRPEQRSIAQLRRGLRSEYIAVRILLVIVVLVAAVDAARALAFATGATRAGASPLAPWAVYAEAAGLILAALTLAAYAWTFGGDIARIGAV